MPRSRLGNIVIDCQTDDLLSEARFWSAALGYTLPALGCNSRAPHMRALGGHLSRYRNVERHQTTAP
jgi:hypothetical protein